MPASRERILFVTGRLAADLVERVVREVAAGCGFEFEVRVVGISVAALMHGNWLRRKLTIDGPFDRVLLPGWFQGDLAELHREYGVRFELGPKDILDLPQHFGLQGQRTADLSRFDIELFAEINHAPRLSDAVLLQTAKHYRASGADVIDVGCVPGERWNDVGAAVARLREEGFRVSIDSFDREEVEDAVAAGAELVLSVNSSNLAWAKDLPAEWIVIPDDPRLPDVLDGLMAELQAAGRAARVDPILEPVGFGFATSLGRYYDVRRRRPDWPMLMGIGNVTELSEVDSAGLNFLLAAICQELRIGSILTTEVANFARSSVREFDLARRLVKDALDNRRLVKNIDSPLLTLRDPRLRTQGPEALAALARQLTDPNFRVFVEQGQIHVMNRDGYWRGDDAFELFDRFSAKTSLDAGHAFYLGFELAKATAALRLGKQYAQDQPLRWGFLSWPEPSAHERRRQQSSAGPPEGTSEDAAAD
ncbi:MAG: dihydropteroate synthase [Planctomyces sp.]|nr:dihydropteroate synthase [Planctomyces sp.]